MPRPDPQIRRVRVWDFIVRLFYWTVAGGVVWVEALHEVTANIFNGEAALHIFGTINENIRHREKLTLAMISGYKRAAEGTDIDNAPVAD